PITYYLSLNISDQHLDNHYFFLLLQPPPKSTLFPYTTLFRSHYPWAGPVLGWRSCQQCVLLTAFLFVRSESFHVLGSSGRRAQRSRARTSTWSRTVSAGSSNRKDVRIRMGCH